MIFGNNFRCIIDKIDNSSINLMADFGYLIFYVPSRFCYLVILELGFVRLEVGRNYFVRVEHDADLVRFVAEFSVENNIEVGSFTAVGALKSAKLGFYEQKKHNYLEVEQPFPCEIASCVGNISLKNDEVFVHAHVVLADEKGRIKAGHLLEGKVFAAEVHFAELLGERLERDHDKVTGLSLWKLKTRLNDMPK
jgi:predicted DNA-binding protein with PD1-like motif